MDDSPMRTRAQRRQGYQPLKRLLKDCRDAAELTREQLADRLGEGWLKSTVQKAESGERRVDFHEFVAWMHACGADPHRALDEYLQASAYPVDETAGKWPMDARETADQEAKEKATSLLAEAAALLKKDKRKSPRKNRK